ncbi:hypothetical protein Pan216_14580 [Planctomycetes bacterium Pan216]|uniref:Uncharacterized protein n=1 Tax=Kolteria novifilia TaxID=2527975 RepID=A0A518B0U9_9BACT|nr:hypothetical protein Pan216_14580 [Planctomycetes bacterium Pan216]
MLQDNERPFTPDEKKAIAKQVSGPSPYFVSPPAWGGTQTSDVMMFGGLLAWILAATAVYWALEHSVGRLVAVVAIIVSALLLKRSPWWLRFNVTLSLPKVVAATAIVIGSAIMLTRWFGFLVSAAILWMPVYVIVSSWLLLIFMYSFRYFAIKGRVAEVSAGMARTLRCKPTRVVKLQDPDGYQEGHLFEVESDLLLFLNDDRVSRFVKSDSFPNTDFELVTPEMGGELFALHCLGDPMEVEEVRQTRFRRDMYSTAVMYPGRLDEPIKKVLSRKPRWGPL